MNENHKSRWAYSGQDGTGGRGPNSSNSTNEYKMLNLSQFAHSAMRWLVVARSVTFFLMLLAQFLSFSHHFTAFWIRKWKMRRFGIRSKVLCKHAHKHRGDLYPAHSTKKSRNKRKNAERSQARH